MDPGDRAVFIAAYGRLVVEVWSDPAREELLERDPRQLLTEYGIAVPDDVPVTVRRDAGDAEPDLETQVEAWKHASDLGELVLFVPALESGGEIEIDERELENVVAGLEPGTACCCPCCCT
ncbi:hypothetical protein GCM10010435_59730 [Winogradskya consettensis]|uniref:Nitrile hydratase alpha /Thiocyanate hydrolase gamma domain-containing protein n=1 Tax=Winogradskya consettensis TaxID=113560 RepID=A0A919VVA8_9ACTN|nr:hypothetical protein [Actinoplanes consettensis]GIM76510.1 hypothetical protein Aco04nite_50830 [Actinoplanes consettensis]